MEELDRNVTEMAGFKKYALPFMHLADAFIQSDLQYIQAIHLLSVCVFSGN